jgi:hypothetical protein
MDDGKVGSTHKITICETLRNINDLVQGDSKKDKKIRKLVVQASELAKKVGGRLKFYADIYHKGEPWDKDMWKENRKVYEKREMRKRNSYKWGE